MPHRPLERSATQNGGGHEGGNAALAETHALAEHMAQAVKRAAQQARANGADHANG